MQYRAQIPTHMREITRRELNFISTFLPPVTISFDIRYDGRSERKRGAARFPLRFPADNAHLTPTRIGT